jgi:Zn-dependent membrane protease YugP
MYPFWFPQDPLYLIATLVGLVLTLWAQFRVKSAFARFAQVGVRSNMTGAEAAAAVARAGNASGVRIERHQGFLSDHYDPRSRTLRLSPDVYDGRSVSSIAVAAHEAGHAIQHVVGYPALGLRSALVPLANIGSRLWMLPFIIGISLANGQHAAQGSATGQIFVSIGILLFAGVVLFQLVTLPVEFDASRRAKAVLAQAGIVQTSEEARGVDKVLDAAAMTYLAAALAGVLQLVALIAQANRRRN